jgi:hypothetical protein
MSEIHISIDIGLVNFGVFILEVYKEDWSWKKIHILATFDLTDGSEYGGKKANSIVARNLVNILDSLIIIRKASIVLIEEQYINTFGGKFMMNNEARRVENMGLGYFSARKKDWNSDMKIYIIPSRLKIADCPKIYKKKKVLYKEWTKWYVVDYLRLLGFEEEAVIVENLKKGDEAGDTIKQYKQAIVNIKDDPEKYRW